MDYKIEERLGKLVKILDEFKLVKHITPLEVYFLKSDETSLAKIKKEKRWTKHKFPYIFLTDNSYTWFKCKFNIDKKNNKFLKSYLGIDTFIDCNTDCNMRPQGLLYLNDQLIQGIDTNHFDSLIEKDGHYEMYMHLYTHELKQVEQYFNTHAQTFPLYFSIKYIDKRIEKAFFEYSSIYQSLLMLKKDDKRYIDSIKVINEAINLIDVRNPDDKLLKSLEVAHKYLLDNYYNKLCGKENYEVAFVGHSHIDMAWLWDLAQTHQKGQRTFSSVLKLMDEYPDYKFIHTSPALFKFIKEDNPALYRRIKLKVKEGRFEIDGATWVEPDCNLTSGESIVRQILYGTSFIKEEFDIDCKALILPDVFGYCYQLPQILNKCDIHRFITAKIGWNDTNRLPYDSFNWIGLDGSSVFTYLISTCWPNPRFGIKDTTVTGYNGMLNAQEILGAWNRYEDKKYNNLIISTYGYGDGGGGPTREMIEREKIFSYGLPGLGKTKLMGLSDALDIVIDNFNKSCKKYKVTPTWNNELYLEFHRGTYTSVPRIKKYNRETEFLLSNVELTSSLNYLINKNSYPKDLIDKHYETFLLHQFHDILPGSAIKKVYDDADIYFKEIKDDCNALIKSNTLKLFKDSEYIAFNPNSFVSNFPIFIDGKCFVVKDLPSIGYKSFKPILSDNSIKISDRHIENEYFDIRFNNNGEIIYLFDKLNKKQLVRKGESINKFVVYDDTPFVYDNWEISAYYKFKKYPLSKVATFTKIDEGDRKGFKIVRKYYNSVFTQFIYIYNGLNRIDFINKVSWKEKRQLVKIHFPFNIDTKKVRCDIQFGSIDRNTIPKDNYDEAKFEICAHKWVDLSDGKYGCALLNDSKYGYSCNGSDIALTVLKSGSYPFPEASDVVPDFTFSLYPHKGTYECASLINESYSINRPAILIHNKNEGYKEIKGSFIEIKEPGIYIETLKKAHKENSFIVRGFEAINKERDINIKINLPFKNAYLTNLLEKNISKLKINNGIIKLHIKPFEIFTIKLV